MTRRDAQPQGRCARKRITREKRLKIAPVSPQTAAKGCPGLPGDLRKWPKKARITESLGVRLFYLRCNTRPRCDHLAK
ncbi:hypothetical protein PUN4_1060026 [Paraburkholderia unamae]|nr:hypothetical protein PUN4_1060026 [Paraburkholderia unamae]